MKISLKKWQIIILAAIVIIGGVGGVWLFTSSNSDKSIMDNQKKFETIEEMLNGSAKSLKIEAVDGDAGGVDIHSQFKIYAEDNEDLSLMQSSISVIPNQTFSIDQVSRSEYTLRFEEALKNNSIYKITVKSEEQGINVSKAFQTRRTFRITRTLPRQKSTYVPVDSGIEITFSHKGVDNLNDFFEITPKVEGQFEKHGDTVVFVPDYLDYETVYKVKLGKGIGFKDRGEVTKEDYIFQFQTESKTENKNNNKTLSFSNRMNNYSSKELPILNVYASSYYRDKTLDIELYRYSDEEAFLDDLCKNDSQPIWAVRRYEDSLFDKSQLENTLSFKDKIYDMGSPYYRQAVIFPDTVEQGYYLVVASYGDDEYMTHMQVNDISAYIMVGEEKCLAWVNDIDTGQPIEGVKIEGDGVVSGISNEKGIVEFELNENKKNQCYLTLLAQNKYPFITYIENTPYLYMYEDEYANIAQKYWSYLYLDRGMYLPTDNIHIWGVVKARQDSSPNKLTVQIEKYANDRYGESISAVLAAQDVEISPYGAYTCSFEYENYNPGSYYITVKSNDEVIERRYFMVKKYTKPAYKINVTTDKKAIALGESVQLDAEASFFEGSPVAGLKLYYRSSSWYDYVQSVEKNIECNRNGHVSIQHKPKFLAPDTQAVSWRPIHIRYFINNATAEDEEVYVYESVRLFPRDIMIYGEGSVEQDGFIAKIKTNKIVLDRINSDNLSSHDMKNYKGEAVNVQLKGRLIEKRWDKKEDGQYYDFINKVTRKKYKYFTVENVLDKFTVNTVNGQATYEFPYTEFSKHNSYYIEVDGYDGNGRAVDETIHLYQSYTNASQLENMESIDAYSLKQPNNQYRFKADENINLLVLRNKEEFELSEQGRILYMILKDGIQSVHISNSSKLSFEFKESYIPNAHVKVICFDGKQVYDGGSFVLNYDYSQKELNIEITPDKEVYKPGDVVHLDIETKDKDGFPCESEVNVSAVDEAFFAIRDQSVYTIGEIYRYAFGTGILTEYFSYKNNEQQPNFAECGEGGDEGEQRYDFKDNAYFGSIRTDKKGQADIQFALPHNLTSWRITYQGITKDLKAGNGRENIQTKLPFFINLILNDVYFAQDQPAISLRAFGTDLKQENEIAYKLVLEGPNNLQKTYNIKGLAKSFSHIMLDALEPGNYVINVYAKTGEFKDAIKKEFKVVDNVLETVRMTYLNIDKGMDISKSIDMSSENSIAELVFYNKGISDYYRTLNALYYSWGQRVDQVLSRQIAGEYLKEYFDKDYIITDKHDLSDYQIYDGGIALFSYDSSSPILSAKVCSAAKDTFDEVNLRSYFYQQIDNEETTLIDLAACYWGLASLGEPVLLDIYEHLQREDVGLEEKLYYGIALSELGDDASAEKVYKEVIGEYGEMVKPYVFLNVGSDRDENIRLTALCAIMSLKSGLLGYEELFQYTMDNGTDEILINLERLIYMTSQTPNAQKESSFSFSTNNKSESLTLKGLDRYRLVLTGDALKNLKLNDIKGDIEVAVNYTGPVKDLIEEENRLVNMKRSYVVEDKKSNTFTQSDIIEIQITLDFDENAPDGYYEITDVLPSGFKYIQPNRGGREDYRWGSVNGQKITFAYYYEPDSKQSKTIKYLARVIAPGKYTADSGIALHGKSKAHGFTEQKLVTIVSADE